MILREVRCDFLGWIYLAVLGSVSSPLCVCVKIGKGMQSNTTVLIKVYLMAILDNYMFRPLLTIFRLSYCVYI